MKTWNIIGSRYDALVGETGDINHKTYLNPVVLRLVGSIKDKKTLDLGCGQGYFSRILAKKGAQVVGIDLADKLLDIAKNKEKPIGPTYFCRNAANLYGLKGNSFDIIVSNMAFNDISNIKGAIKECARVLRPTGKIIFSIPHPWRDLAQRKRDKAGYYLRVNRYKSAAAEKHFLSDKLKFYHRPIDFYLQELFKNGFVVSNFLEIAIKHHHGEKIKSRALLRSKQEIPSFLVVEGTKLR